MASFNRLAVFLPSLLGFNSAHPLLPHCLCLPAFDRIGGYHNLEEAYLNAVPATIIPNTTCHLPRPDALHLFQDARSDDLPWTGMTFGLSVLAMWYWCTDQVSVAASSPSPCQSDVRQEFLPQVPGQTGLILQYSAPWRGSPLSGFYWSLWLVVPWGFLLGSDMWDTLFFRCLDWDSLDNGMPSGVLISSSNLWLSWNGDGVPLGAVPWTLLCGRRPGWVCLLGPKPLLGRGCWLPRGAFFALAPSRWYLQSPGIFP
uniref:Uncharacterized protein n=1 Tax=Sphaerodactylus townsendi TaxID=933632 RepID=A0ACB8FK21_9SAUR